MSKQNATGHGQQPAELDSRDRADFRTALGIAYKHPLEVIRQLASSVYQIGERVGGLQFNPDRDIGDQTGRVILVTGGNNGLGKQTVLQLARHRPARIYLTSRNETKGREAIKFIQSTLEGPLVDIRYLPLDLASFDSVRAAVARFTAECDRLDTLVLNAGVMAVPVGKTEDGYEVQFGTNHVGHFLLTKLLMPTLQRTVATSKDSDVRILSVASAAWQTAPVSPSAGLELMMSTPALCEQTTLARYGLSKAANILFAAELARRYPEITSVSVHPGIIATGLYGSVEQMGTFMKYFVEIIRKTATTEERGVLNHLWAVASPKEKLTNGAFYTPIGSRSWSNPYVRDVEVGKKLWEWTDEQVSRSQ